MAGELPPVVARFLADTTAFVAGIERAIASDESLAEATAAAEAAIRAMQDGLATAAAAATEAAAAQERLAGAQKGAGDAAGIDAEMQQALAEAERVSTEAAMASVDASIALAKADRTAGEAATVMAGATEKATVATRASGGAAGTAVVAHNRFNKALLGVGAAAGYGVVQAAKFQSEVQRLYTAAGLTGAKFEDVSRALLKIGDQTGIAGTQIAEAMYHPVSAGLNLAQSLQTVANAAKLAKIHGADLEDTTYALSSVMKAYNVDARNVSGTSALLNSIVGQGDMRFQDFNQSIKNWTPTGAAMGITIQSMGAALAYLTDRGNSAEVASTRLTMGLSMVTSGSKAANVYLRDLGLTTGSLNLRNKSLQQTMEHAGLTTNRVAADLKKPDGIFVALHDMQDAFHRSGLSAEQANQVMSKIFGGGRSDKAIVALMQNLNGVRDKYDEIGKAAGHYGTAWAKTQQTTTQQWHTAVAQVKNLAVEFGSTLLPAVTSALGGINKLFGGLLGSRTALDILKAVVPAILAVVAAIKIWTIVQAVLNAVMDANPISLVIVAIGALVAAIIYAWQHFAWFRDGVKAVGHAIKQAWDVLWHGCEAVMKWFVNGPLKSLQADMKVFTEWWKQHGDQVKKVAEVVWKFVQMVIHVYWTLIMAELKIGLALLKAVWTFAWGFIKDLVKLVWDEIAGVIKFWVHLIMNIIAVVLDLITGKWGKAWKDLKKLAGDALHDVISLIKNVTSDFGNLLWDAGKNLIQGLINGIKSMAGGVWDAIKGIAGNISGFFPHSPAKHGPLSGSGDPLLSGQQLAARIAAGMLAGAPGVSAAATALAAAGMLPSGAPIPLQPTTAQRREAKKLQTKATSADKRESRYEREEKQWMAKYRKYVAEARSHKQHARYDRAAEHALAEAQRYAQQAAQQKQLAASLRGRANRLLHPVQNLPHMPRLNALAAARPEYWASQAAVASLRALQQSTAASWSAGGIGAGLGSAPSQGVVVQHVVNVNVEGSVRSDRDLLAMIQSGLMRNRLAVTLPAGR
ncbi:phage tail tape measure protein [Actinomadura harenae]|uniref:Phage tail tape measure protein n=1 Tax=Actinomadura harenae TaxID=2483351 RepID=A0A3M2MF09_9ACTN|nr:phage tail tape measure protein [Actinomadura harenae]RMI47610.1 phage tail tape measure protein [Actinomadura harenae]